MTAMRCEAREIGDFARSVRNLEKENNDLVTKVRKICGDNCSVSKVFGFSSEAGAANGWDEDRIRFWCSNEKGVTPKLR